MGKLDNGLRRTKGGFFNAIAKAFSNSQIEDDFYEELLDNLVMRWIFQKNRRLSL